MSYELANLRDIEDSAVGFGLSPDVEAHFARKPLGMDRGGVSYQRLAPHVRQPFGHRHEDQEEVYVILGGSGRASLGDELVDVKPLDALRVSPETVRAFEAGPDGLEFLAFGAGRAGDTQMIEGFWAGNGDR